MSHASRLSRITSQPDTRGDIGNWTAGVVNRASEATRQWRTQEFPKDQGIALRGASRSVGAPSAGHWREGRRHWREGRRHWREGRHRWSQGRRHWLKERHYWRKRRRAAVTGWKELFFFNEESPNEVPDDYHVLNDVCNGPSRTIHINAYDSHLDQ